MKLPSGAHQPVAGIRHVPPPPGVACRWGKIGIIILYDHIYYLLCKYNTHLKINYQIFKFKIICTISMVCGLADDWPMISNADDS
jgi:hypothetical protein